MEKFHNKKVITNNAAYEVVGSVLQARQQALKKFEHYRKEVLADPDDDWYRDCMEEASIEAHFWLETLSAVAQYSPDATLKEYAEYAISKLEL